jgi:CrcB protein
MFKLLLIAIGGAVGTLARYGTSTAMMPWSERFPWGTLTVNLVGCFIMGCLQGMFAERWMIRPEYQAAILVGFLGGLTTFSSYGWESFAFMQAGQFWRAGANILLNNVAGIVLVLLGYGLGAKWL